MLCKLQKQKEQGIFSGQDIDTIGVFVYKLFERNIVSSMLGVNINQIKLIEFLQKKIWTIVQLDIKTEHFGSSFWALLGRWIWE